MIAVVVFTSTHIVKACLYFRLHMDRFREIATQNCALLAYNFARNDK